MTDPTIPQTETPHTAGPLETWLAEHGWRSLGDDFYSVNAPKLLTVVREHDAIRAELLAALESMSGHLPLCGCEWHHTARAAIAKARGS